MEAHKFFSVCPGAPRGAHALFVSECVRSSVDSPRRIAAFLAQLAHESGEFRRLEENLKYSATRLLQVFGKYFIGVDVADYAGRPSMIANRVYANRMGNGPEISGDGFRYRGRGYIQLSGKANYAKYGERVAVDLLSEPHKAASPAFAMQIAGEFWTDINGNLLADNGDMTMITRKINGGLNGLAERLEYYHLALGAILDV